MRFILLIFAFFLGWSQQGQSADSKTQDAQLSKIIQLVYDEPVEAVRLGQELAREVNPAQNPQLFVKIAAAVSEAASLYGDAQEITRWVDAALPLAESLSLNRERIILYSMKAVAFEFQGNFIDAEKQHQFSLDEARKLKDPQLEVFAAVYLAFFYSRSADLKEFTLLVEKTFQLFRSLPHDALYHIFLAVIAMSYDTKVFDRSEERIKLLRESLAYFEAKSIKFLSYQFTHSLAMDLEKKNPEEALRVLTAAAEKNHLFSVPEHKAYIDDLKGNIYFTLKDYSKAIEFYGKALAYWEARKTNENFQQRARLDIARGYLELGQYERAWNEQQKIHDFMRNKAQFLYLYFQTKARIMAGLGRTKDENEALGLALKYYQSFMDERNAEITKTAMAQLDLKRLEDDRKLLEAQNKAQTLELKEARATQRVVIAILVMVLGFLILALHSIRKSREVRAKKQELQDILDTIDEGILRIGRDLHILPDYSRHAEVLLGVGPLLGQDLIPLLFGQNSGSLELKSMVEQSLRLSLGESSETWDFNSGHLPKQINRQGRILSLFWQPLLDKSNTIAMVILSMRDITEHVELEKMISAEKALQEALDHKLTEIKQVDLERSSRFLLKQFDWWKVQTGLDYDLARSAAHRAELHTIKGEARTLGLMSLSSRIHDFEGFLQESPDGNSFDSYRHHLSAILEVVGQYKTIIEKFFIHLHPHQARDLLVLCSEMMQDPRRELEKAGVSFGGLTVQDHYGNWSEAKLDALRPILIHAFTNSIDHGFIRRKEQLGTSYQAHFEISAAQRRGCLVLEFRDNGAGIDWNIVREKALERGFTATSQQDLADFLFQDGASTAKDVSLLSGRGVGLSAIRYACHSLQGRARLGDNDQGPGTLLVIEIPDTHWDGLRSAS